MDHTQELDMIVVDAVLDKVEVALGLVDRAGQELNDALLLEPGSDGLEHIEALLHRASAGLRCELKIAGRSGHGVAAHSGTKSVSSPAASAASPTRPSRPCRATSTASTSESPCSRLPCFRLKGPRRAIGGAPFCPE